MTLVVVNWKGNWLVYTGCLGVYWVKDNVVDHFTFTMFLIPILFPLRTTFSSFFHQTSCTRRTILGSRRSAGCGGLFTTTSSIFQTLRLLVVHVDKTVVQDVLLWFPCGMLLTPTLPFDQILCFTLGQDNWLEDLMVIYWFIWEELKIATFKKKKTLLTSGKTDLRKKLIKCYFL